MNSFSNLSYTLGGSVSPGCGLERFGYIHQQSNKNNSSQNLSSNDVETAGHSHLQLEQQNEQQSRSGTGWNGWQYNAGPPHPTPAPTNSNQKQNLQTQTSDIPKNMTKNVINGSQMSGPTDWRNITGQNVNFNYHPVTTTGISPFVMQNSYQTQFAPDSNSKMYLQQGPGQGQQQMISSAQNVPNLNGNNTQRKSLSPTCPNQGVGVAYNPMIPLNPGTITDPNICDQKNFPQAKPLACHVKIGNANEAPIIYSNPGYENQNKQEEPNPPFQFQFQGPISTMTVSFPPSGDQNQSYTVQSENPNPTSINPTASSTQSVKIKKCHSPCGQCSACKFSSGDAAVTRGRMIPGQPQLVREPRPPKLVPQRTESSPQMDVKSAGQTGVSVNVPINNNNYSVPINDPTITATTTPAAPSCHSPSSSGQTNSK